VLVVVCVAVEGLVAVVVSSVVVVLVCANANGATSPQTKAIIVLFTLMPPFDWFTSTLRDSESERTLLGRLTSRLVMGPLDLPISSI